MMFRRDAPVTEDEISAIVEGFARRNVFPEWAKPAPPPEEVMPPPEEVMPPPEEVMPPERVAPPPPPKPSVLPLALLAVGALLVLGRK